MTYKYITVSNCRASNNPYEAVDDLYAILGSRVPLIYHTTSHSLAYDISVCYDRGLKKAMVAARDLALRFYYQRKLVLLQRRENGLVYYIAQPRES